MSSVVAIGPPVVSLAGTDRRGRRKSSPRCGSEGWAEHVRWSAVQESSLTVKPDAGKLAEQLEQYRSELKAYCYRMLGSPFDAEDAVQETFIRAWRGFERFEGRAALRSWLYRIATNVSLDMLNGKERRARPMDLGPAQEPVESNLNTLPEVTWIEPVPDSLVVAADGDPAEVAVSRETIRLAFVAALQHLPPRQRAVLILCEVLRWKASEVAELLDTSVASVNRALQRARATLESTNASAEDASTTADEVDAELLDRYVKAFEQYDMAALTSLIQEDATQSMPPFDMWLSGRDDILAWWLGPGIGCRGSRVIPTVAANGSPAFGQYKPSESGSGFDPWALQVLEIADGRIVEFTFFLDTDRLFPLFGLPPRLES
ncbi:MAG: sigma-70 family RNA polymerase sigma factor [Actinobacteria bacterium]|nr:MAG: sigma-70 family RNA polymerase sigma factor [Actinomycetota bacterium]